MKKLRSIAMLAALVTPVPAMAGYYYETTMVDTNEKGKELSRIVSRAWIDGASAKVEFVDGPKGSPFGNGAYLLTTDGGHTLYLVDPKEKAYSRWDMQAMMAFAGSIMESMGPMFEMEFSEFSSAKIEDANGPEMHGHSTRHVRWRTDFDMKMKILGMRKQYTSTTDQQFWLTEDVDDEAFGVWLRPDNFRTGNDELDGLIENAYIELRGFPLKSESITKMVTKKGKETITRSAMNVDVLHQESIAAGIYELPAGFEERPSLTTMQPPQGADGADTSNLEEEPEKKGVFKSLRSRFPGKKKD